MRAKEIIRHVIGYAVGLSLFFVLVPFLLWFAAMRCDPLHPIVPRYNPALMAVAMICAVVGIIFVLWSNAALFFIGKGGPTDGLGVTISPRTKHLVISGPYRYTRNPMIFGAVCCYIAWGLLLNSPLVVALVVMLIPAILFYLSKTEEKRLREDFGEKFIEYRERVPMFFPKFTFKKKD